MRKLIVTEYITVDGVFQDPGGQNKQDFPLAGWSFDFWNEEAGKYKYDELFNSGALLLGRVTYEGFAKAWPTMEGTGDFGERMNSMPKYVVSTTLQKAEWNNTTIIKDNIISEILDLKNQSGQDILVAGSGELLHTLLQNSLVDEIRLLVHPVVLGSGKRLFKDLDYTKLKLLEAKTFSTGMVALHYETK